MRNEPFTIVVDTREQRPLDFRPYEQYGVTVERAALKAGDYSVKGLENQVFVERKSLEDLVGTLSQGRDRFMREIYNRAMFASLRLLVVEAPWSAVSRPYGFSAMNPECVVDTVCALAEAPTYIQHYMSASRDALSWYVYTRLYNFIRRTRHGASGTYAAIFSSEAADIGIC